MGPGSHRTSRVLARGYTLIELMTVVAIVGVLAVLATYGVRKYIYASKTSEAFEMINSIRLAEESYKAERLAYLNVSGSFDSALSGFYPGTTPGQIKYSWGGGTGSVADGWRTLGVQPSGPVQYVFGCVAGNGNTAPAKPWDTGHTFAPDLVSSWPTGNMGQPWYVVVAVGDLDGDGKTKAFASPSFQTSVFEGYSATDADY